METGGNGDSEPFFWLLCVVILKSGNNPNYPYTKTYHSIYQTMVTVPINSKNLIRF